MNTQPYLTLDEYNEYTTSTMPLMQEEFDRYLKGAETTIDLLTRSFYRFHLIEQDTPYRQLTIKKALSYQIDYLRENSGTSLLGTSTVQTVTIGRTTLSSGTSSNTSSTSGNYPIEVIYLLQTGGFLYSGVRTSCL